jgi:hypothetical protein
LESPGDYFQGLTEVISNSHGPHIEDLFVVPDYDQYFKNCCDPKFGSYAKGEKTQLQFIFEATEPNYWFPLGCRTTYRAYSADKVIEIVEGEEEISSLYPGVYLQPRQCIVPTFPQPAVDGTYPGGMHILRNWPIISELPWKAFIPKAREIFDEVMAEVRKHWAVSKPQTVRKWQEWSVGYIPDSDEIEDYKAK